MTSSSPRFVSLNSSLISLPPGRRAEFFGLEFAVILDYRPRKIAASFGRLLERLCGRLPKGGGDTFAYL
jgi:hypothetical protein